MTYTNLPTPPAVHDAGDHHTESGVRVPAAEVRSREIAEQAGRWLTFATERTRMKPHTLTSKALASVAFSVHHGASSFAVPSKLTGTSEHQRALWTLVRDPAEPWARLELDAAGDGLTAVYDGEALGAVQSKHLGWLRLLIPFGLTLHLARVTGHDYEAYTLGCNVVFGHVGTALAALHEALGASGDGALGAPSGPVTAAVIPAEAEGPSGDGAAQGVTLEVSPAPRPGLRLVVRPEANALSGHPDDVVFWRRIDGSGHASVPHVRRHSDALDWGRTGSGPADLSLSVLTAVCGAETAEALYGPFANEVVAAVPHAGGVLLAADVRAWVDAHSAC